MTIHTLDSVSWFAEKHSFSIEGMQGNAMEEEVLFLSRVPISRASRYDAFPPPLESPTICNGNFSHIGQVDRVCFTSVRRDGRLILVEKPQPLLPRRSILSQRSNGRLQLRLYVDNTQQNQLKQENPIAEISSLPHEHRHSPLARNNFDVQKQHNSLAAVSLLKHSPFAENTLRPAHPHCKPSAKSVSPRRDEHGSIAMHALQEQHNPTMTNTLPGHHRFLRLQNRPSRVANNSLHGRPSGKGFSPGPIQHNPCAEFGEEQNSKAENARHDVCVQEQHGLVASMAFSVEHRHQSRMAESSSPVARIAFSVEQCEQRPLAESSSLQQSPNAGMERQESPDAEIARKRNPNAEIANPIAEIEEPSAEIARKGNPSIAENAGKKRNSRAEKAKPKKTREEKAKQENASAGKARLIRGERDLLKQSRVLMKCDAYNNSTFKPYYFTASISSLAFLHNSLRPLCMLNL